MTMGGKIRTALRRCLAAGLAVCLLAALPAAAADFDNPYSAYAQENQPLSEQAGTATAVFASDGLGAGAQRGAYGGRQDVAVLAEAGASVTFAVQVSADGLYAIVPEYTGCLETDKTIKMGLQIDGAQPFFEAGELELPRCYENATNDFETDALGNELRPEQRQCVYWQQTPFFQEEVGTNAPYYFHLTAGAHTVELTAKNGGVAVAGLTLTGAQALRSYADYAAEYGNQPVGADEPLILQGEKAVRKSDISLYPTTDRTSCATQPFSESQTRLNTIGGSNWSNPGQWLEWELDVQTTGLYRIDLRVRQNANQGMRCYRKILLDGAVPFAELEQYGFAYRRSWYIDTLSDEAGKPFDLYLEAGHHVLRMEVTAGSLSEPLEQVNGLLTELNDLYHTIIMITGTAPDTYRDYNLEKAIPGLVDTMNRLADALDAQMQRIRQLTGGSGTQAVSITTLSDQLRTLAQHPKGIPDRVSNFYSNISAVSAWVNSAFQQPLEIDYLRLSHVGSEPLQAGAGFVRSLVSAVKSFIASFVTDYDSVGAAAGKTDITVWAMMGREQAESLKSLIDRDFSEKTGIGVSLKLVQSGLVEAVVAGTGPDIALSVPMNYPVDFASRKILTALDEQEGFDSHIAENYYPNALKPFVFRGHTYALAETQEFNMMFCRTDILSQLGLAVPQTWEELTDLTAVLARNNMQIGISSLTSTSAGVINTAFPKMVLTLFMQRGTPFYTDDLRSTNLKSVAAIRSFGQLTDFYTKYGLPIYFDANNRFRTGEMPIIIAPLSTYNTLAISAPEIAGRWSIDRIPGTVQADGSINRAGEFTATGCVMFRSAKDTQACWSFLKWWTSADTQYRYGMELEAVLGASGRYMTANRQAFEKLPWDSATAATIRSQWAETDTVPQVPGYYFVSRHLTNAISDTIVNGENAQVALERYADTINAEMKRKSEQIDALWDE